MATERYGEAHRSGVDIRLSRLRASQAVDLATARTTRRLHAVSAHVADTTSASLRYPRDRIDVVYRGRADPGKGPIPRDVAAMRTALAPRADFVVLAVARHEPAKGIDRLLDAWAKAGNLRRHARLLVAGREGSATPALRRMSSDFGLDDSVRFLGHRDDIPLLHALSDLFVLPSRREGLPGALLEAIALRSPAVVADLPQVREVVGETEAWLVDAGDSDELGRTLLAALANPDARACRAMRARLRFEECFTLSKSADGMASFYTRAMS